MIFVHRVGCSASKRVAQFKTTSSGGWSASGRQSAIVKSPWLPHHRPPNALQVPGGRFQNRRWCRLHHLHRLRPRSKTLNGCKPTHRLSAAPAGPAAQTVQQLRQAHALGVFDHHQAGVGRPRPLRSPWWPTSVQMGLVAAERRHRVAQLCRRHPAVRQATATPGSAACSSTWVSTAVCNSGFSFLRSAGTNSNTPGGPAPRHAPPRPSPRHGGRR